MEDKDKRYKEGKLPSHDISLSGAASTVAERPHGKLYRWLDNFWYHYKWPTIIALVAALIVTVCVLQMCNREKEGDVGIVLAGPYGFTDNGEGYEALMACLSTYLPQDYDGDGARRITAATYSIYSEEQILALREKEIPINTAENSQYYNDFFNYLKLGEAAVLFLDPFLFEELAENNGYLIPLEESFDTLPEGSLTAGKEGEEKPYGVRLGDTALYRNNAAVRVLPEDTVICLLAPFAIGKNDDPAEYQKSVDLYLALIRAVA